MTPCFAPLVPVRKLNWLHIVYIPVVELGFGHTECELFPSVFSVQARVSKCTPDPREVELVGYCCQHLGI